MITSISKIKTHFEIYLVNIFKLLRVLSTLKKTYSKTPTYSLSKQYRAEQEPENPDLIYGELSVYSFLYLLVLVSKNKSKLNKTYDLGCGDAKLMLAAALYFENMQAVGVEKVPALVEPILESGLPENLQIIQNSFLEIDFFDADLIYINGAVFQESTWLECCEKFELLNTGCYVISVVREIKSPNFILIYSALHSASWGKALVHIYRKFQ